MSYLNPDEKLYISPHIRCENEKLIFELSGKEVSLNELEPEDLLEILKDTIEGWYFKPIEALLSLESQDRFFKGVIVLLSLLPIIELVGQIKTGEFSYRESSEAFKEGFKTLFKWNIIEEKDKLTYHICDICETEVEDEAKLINLIYHHMRNGLVHNAMFKVGIKFSFDYTYPIEVEIGNKEQISEKLAKTPQQNFEKFNLVIKINPKAFFEYLKSGFLEFLALIQTNEGYKKNLKKIFSELHGKLKSCRLIVEKIR